MPAPNRSPRLSEALVRKYPYAFFVFLIGYVALSITIWVITHSLILGGLALLFAWPFVLLAVAVWAVVKAIVRTIFFEL